MPDNFPALVSNDNLSSASSLNEAKIELHGGNSISNNSSSMSFNESCVSVSASNNENIVNTSDSVQENSSAISSLFTTSGVFSESAPTFSVGEKLCTKLLMRCRGTFHVRLNEHSRVDLLEFTYVAMDQEKI
jgi:hypothetical protein